MKCLQYREHMCANAHAEVFHGHFSFYEIKELVEEAGARFSASFYTEHRSDNVELLRKALVYHRTRLLNDELGYYVYIPHEEAPTIMMLHMFIEEERIRTEKIKAARNAAIKANMLKQAQFEQQARKWAKERYASHKGW